MRRSTRALNQKNPSDCLRGQSLTDWLHPDSCSRRWRPLVTNNYPDGESPIGYDLSACFEPRHRSAVVMAATGLNGSIA